MGARAGRMRSVAGAAASMALLLAGCFPGFTPKAEQPQPVIFPRGVPASAQRPQKPVVTRITAADGRAWRSLALDGLHDAGNPAIDELHEPAEALAALPKDGEEGDQVDWVAALESGIISPKASLYGGAIRRRDDVIVMPRTAGMPAVLFPHRQHGEWLDCSNCHDALFAPKRGANLINMESILNGEFCGRCHGAVAFPPTRCERCHSVAKTAEAGE